MRKFHKSDRGGSHLDNKPEFVAIGKIVKNTRDGLFMKVRRECFDLGFTLERGIRGYNLEGQDLPAGGVECATLNDVNEELDNYR